MDTLNRAGDLWEDWEEDEDLRLYNIEQEKCYEKKKIKMKAPFITYAVYENPSDYPHQFVVRRWINESPEPHPLCVVETLGEARRSIPAHLTMLLPSKHDDPVIIETWI